MANYPRNTYPPPFFESFAKFNPNTTPQFRLKQQLVLRVASQPLLYLTVFSIRNLRRLKVSLPASDFHLYMGNSEYE